MANWTGNAYVDALLLGQKWDTSDLTYYLKGSWNTRETNAIEAAFASWADVSNVTFTRVFSEAGADLVEQTTFDFNPGALGAHEVHVDYTTNVIAANGSQLNGFFNYSGYGWDEYSADGGLQVGGLGYLTLVHEIGHALGLDHTHSDGGGDVNVFPTVSSSSDSGDWALNQDVFSAMSYVHGSIGKTITGAANSNNYGFVSGPMAFDIATIQYLYGANLNQNSGNNTYYLPDSNSGGTYFSAIWDTGGIDEIVYNGVADVDIDLRSATLASESGGGGFLSQASGVTGGYVIAGDFTNALADVNGEAGVIIENATGGSGNDTITGNKVANVLNGNGGNDTITGGAGNDTFIASTGNDTIFGGADFDTYDFSSDTQGVVVDLAAVSANAVGAAIGSDDLLGIEKVIAGSGDDHLTGSVFDDTLIAGDGNDVLIGAEGDDTLDGGDGIDTYDASSVVFDVTVDLTAGTASGNTVDNDTLSNIENVKTGAGDDTLIGDGKSNVFAAGAGDDSLDGAGGIDTADYSSDTQGITVDLTAANNHVTGAGVGTDQLTSIENIIGGSGVDNITGDNADNFIRGGAGSDTLDGGGGIDTVSFEGATGRISINLDANGDGVATGVDIGTDTLSGFENILSGAGDDSLSGGGQSNIIDGGAGNDVIIGGAGADQLSGGAGNDILWADSDDLLLDGGSGSDYLIFTDAVDRDITIGAGTFEVVIGNSGIDIIDATGSDSFMVMWGGASGDTLTLGDANGYIYGESGDDTLIGGLNGINTLIGGAGADTIQGGNNIDVMWVDGQDSFHGGGGTGDWAIIASSSGDSINVANKGVEVAAGGVGADTIDARGDANGLVMWGNLGADIFYAGSGTDHFYGGGADGSEDIFHFDDNSNLNVIWDWEDGVDVIDLSSASTGYTITQSGTFDVITYGSNQILVSGAGQIDAGDIII